MICWSICVPLDSEMVLSVVEVTEVSQLSSPEVEEIVNQLVQK
ncbi:unnamed protein product [Brassica oleracea var. botrytis]